MSASCTKPDETRTKARPGLKHFGDYYMAVFNSRPCDVRQVNQEFATAFGADALKPIKSHIRRKGGVMAIFEKGDYTTQEKAMWFIERLAKIADARVVMREASK